MGAIRDKSMGRLGHNYENIPMLLNIKTLDKIRRRNTVKLFKSAAKAL